jgi:hypothetical protein
MQFEFFSRGEEMDIEIPEASDVLLNAMISYKEKGTKLSVSKERDPTIDVIQNIVSI